MSASGCFRSSEDGRVLVDVPKLDSRDEAGCYDPGVDRDAFVAVGENRVALADCRRRHKNVVDQYNDVRLNLGTGKGS